MALGVIYAFLGTVDFVSLIHHEKRHLKIFYLVVQGSLLFALLWTSRLNGQIPVCISPMVSITVALLSPVAATLGVAALYAMVLAIEGHFYGANALFHWSIMMLPSIGFVVIFTQLALMANAARTRAESLSAKIEQLAVIQERNRLAREIHDSLGHFLTTIHVQLQAARAIHASDPGRALEAVAKAQGLAHDALAEVRQSVETLRADQTLAPLATRLRGLASATDGWGAAVSLEVLGETRALAPEVDHALFRAVQEGLTNVRKHAQAQTALVVLDYRGTEKVLVRIKDDGRGGTAGPAGHGLAGLRERISSLGGRVASENPSDGGFCLQIEIPA